MPADLRGRVEQYLSASFLDKEIPSRLSDAMRYSLLAGGKRLRPMLCLAVARACAKDRPKTSPRPCCPLPQDSK